MPSAATGPRRVLFVCLGNICRSAMAEGIFQHKIAAAGLAGSLSCDSASFDRWTPGWAADERAVATAREHGIQVATTARQVRANDYETFDLILAMDRSNLRSLQRGCPTHLRRKLHMMREYDHPPAPDGEIPDPYHGSMADFELVFEILDRCTDSLIARHTETTTP